LKKTEFVYGCEKKKKKKVANMGKRSKWQGKGDTLQGNTQREGRGWGGGGLGKLNHATAEKPALVAKHVVKEFLKFWDSIGSEP